MTIYPHTTWRLLRSAATDGATQMATDEAIWQTVAQQTGPPTLRLYAWQPPCLSLGRSQPLSDVDQESLRRAGYDLVRRPTGGRAILHTDELTYSLVLPLSDPRVRGDVLSSCRRLSAGLLAALRLLGLSTSTAHQPTATPNRSGPVCFETPGDFEITIDGRKLIGSAQMRGRGTLLQHGTLPLYGDLARICALLSTPTDPRHVRRRATTLVEAAGRKVTWEEAAAAMTAGFQEALHVSLEEGELTAEELSIAARLRQEKYTNAAWTGKL